MRNDAQEGFVFDAAHRASGSGAVSRVARKTPPPPRAVDLSCLDLAHLWMRGRLLCECKTRLWLCDEWELTYARTWINRAE